jgi:hypothetical protein
MTTSFWRRAFLPAAAVPFVLIAAAAAGAQNTSAQATPSPEALNPTQEIAKETPEGPALVAGPTEIRIGGYLGVTGIYRSTNSGGGIGTNFGTIPYSGRVPGEVSESRLSAQGSRLSVRIDAAPAPDRAKLAGYFEMDFNGFTPGTVAVTSSSVGLRLRHAFGEAQYRNTFFLAAGQAFSLMTPAKHQLSVWPSEFQISQAVDTNYLSGLVWTRSPQVRFAWRPSPSFNWAISVENPEQQIGGAVKLPACCSEDLADQYNTGSDQLNAPNLMPDVVSRVAFNSGVLHLDAGGVLRVFRHAIRLTPASDFSSVKKGGGGVSINSRIRVTAASQLIGQVAYGPGLGRYIGGLVPDVAVSADGDIHPITTTSWIVGVEQNVPTHASVAIYSGVHADNRPFTDVDGTAIGFGYPGSPDSNNHKLDEWTGVFAWQAWQIAGRGSVQWNTQLSWLSRSPWSRGAGPSSASAFMVLSQLRYNLP